MSEDQTYGVQLDLLTQNYNKKLQDVVNTTQTQAKLIEQKAKVNFGGYSPIMDTKDFSLDLQLKDVENYQDQIKKVLSDLKMGNIDTSQAKKSLDDLLNDVKITNDTFAKNTNIRIRINVDDSELSLLQQAGTNTQLIDKYVELTNQDLGQATNNIKKLENNLSDATKEAQRLNKNTSSISKNTSDLGQNFDKSMNKGVSSAKKLLFSLFSVHSIWSLISRASSNAISLNDGLNSRVSVLNSALGNMVLPVVKQIVNYAEYGVIFTAKIIQFFFGFNALANLTTSNIKNATNQAKQLTKTLAGFDEITNLNQSSNGSLAGGIKNDMQALDDFYKKMEEVEKWMQNSGIYDFLGKVKDVLSVIYKAVLKPLWEYALKPMLEFALNHPEVLTTLFTIFLGNKLKNGIADVLGSSSGTGLLGVHGILGKLAALGIIAISIKVAYDGVKEAINAIEETNRTIENMAKETETAKEATKKWREELLNSQSDSEIFNNLLRVQRSELQLNTDTIDGLIGNLDNMSNGEKIVGEWLQGNNSQYSVNNSLIKENSEKVKENIGYIFELINSQKLNNQETDYFIQNIKETIDKMEEQKSHLSKNSEGYKGLQSAIDFAKISLNQYESQLEQDIKRLEEENTKLDKNSDKYKENQEEIQKAKDKLDLLRSGNYDTTATINVEAKDKTDYSNFATKAAQTIGNIFNKIGGSISSLASGTINSVLQSVRGYDIGTNYVPNDQLAMVHKGEMIVPAKYNPATSGINGGHDEEIIQAIYELKETLENKDMNAYISEDAIGEASSNYRNRRSRQLGRSVD